MPQDLGDNLISTSQIARVNASHVARLSRHRLTPGDIVFSRRGDVTRRALVRQENDGWLCGTGCLKVRPNAGVDAAFLSYAVSTEDAREWLVSHSVGATMPNLNTEILGRLPLQLPPLPEQQAIAEVLGALDDKIAANTKLAAAAIDLASSHFKLISRTGATDTASFEEVATISGGGTPSTKTATYWDGDVAWATPTDMTALSGPFLEATSRTITSEGLRACSSKLFEPGAILMTSRATIGAIAIAQVATAVNQGFIVVEPHDPTLRFWLFHDMKSRVDEFISWANGATFLELSRGNFKRLTVQLPDAGSVGNFHAIAGPLHGSARTALLENRTLAATRDALLPQLMSGKLRVHDVEAAASKAGI